MKKIIVLTNIICCIIFPLTAQENIPGKKYALRTNNTSFGFSSLNLTDHYLSPLPYNGFGICINTENRRLYSVNTPNLSIMNRGKIELGSTLNPVKNAAIWYMGANFGWGMHYHFHPINNLQILAGGIWDLDLGLKLNTRNVNNPFNMDLSTNLNLSAVFIYDIPTAKRTLRLQASFDSPWIGIMFAPEQGISYYEMFLLKSKGHFVHFSSFHNKLALRQNYSIEIPFKNSTWRFGIWAENKKWQTNLIIFKQNNIGLFFGYTRILYRFNQKNPSPSNFITY